AECIDIVDLRICPQPDVHTQLVDLPLHPVRDVGYPIAARSTTRYIDGPSQAIRGLDENDIHASQLRQPSGLHAGGPAANDQHTAFQSCMSGWIGADFQLSADCWVYGATQVRQRAFLRSTDAAVVAPDARPNLLGTDLNRFADQVRVRNVGADH